METNKFIVFKIGDCLMALPLSEVLKVVNCPPTRNTGLKDLGLVQLGKHTIRVLDFNSSVTSDDNSGVSPQSFLVITRNPEGEFCGIAVNEPPNLIELQSDQIRTIPTSEHHSGLLQMVSHAAILSEGDETTTIFLLDVKRFSHPVALLK